MADTEECQHTWEHAMTVQQADYHADKRISRVYWVRIETCPLCGAKQEEVLPETTPTEHLRAMLGLT